MSRAAAVLAGLALAARGAPAQRVTLGPQFVLASYREVTSGLRYQGTGFGVTASARFSRFSVAAAVARVTFNPSQGTSSALQSFRATQVDAWVAYEVAPYASLEAGTIHRGADPDFNAQSLGAVRVGARAFSAVGPGATVAFRADYLAVPHFSGGGRAPVSLDLGLDVDVLLTGLLHGTAAYAFQRANRKTNPGGTGEIDAPLQETLARVGLALTF